MSKLKDFCSENTADIDIPVLVIMTICRHFYVKKSIYLAHINASEAQNSRSEINLSSLLIASTVQGAI